MCYECGVGLNQRRCIKEGDGNTLYIERSTYYYYLVAKAEDGSEVRMRLDYCPSCGRSLNE